MNPQLVSGQKLKKKVKAISEKDRKTIEKIIIASTIKMWKLI